MYTVLRLQYMNELTYIRWKVLLTCKSQGFITITQWMKAMSATFLKKLTYRCSEIYTSI